MPGTLYLVSTPIGNLQDISLRALETLKSVDLVACEDTRHTGRLLKYFGIKRPLVSYHEHNEAARTKELIAHLDSGKSIALVSDAGTPGIADPGFRAVAAAYEAGANVISIPGPSAFLSAAVVSGLPTDSIFFGGFLPSKKAQRLSRLKEVSDVPATLVFYEAPHRLGKSLGDIHSVLGNRLAAVVREITKMHEETVKGTLEELKERYGNAGTKGEVVIVIDRAGKEIPAAGSGVEEALRARVEELEDQGVELKKALKTAAKEFGFSRSEAYRICQLERL